MDVVSRPVRSRMMAGIRRTDTRPELIVRRTLFSNGFRFQLHRKDLPGSPDIVLPRYRVVFFVHGCFWHQHAGCPLVKMPSSNQDFWATKLGKNQQRDRRNIDVLLQAGWKVRVVWECVTRIRNPETPLETELSAAVADPRAYLEIPAKPAIAPGQAVARGLSAE